MESGDIFDCHDRGEGLVASGGWRWGMLLRSLQSTGPSPGHGMSTCQGWEMTPLVNACFISMRSPRTHLKMASVGAGKKTYSLRVLIQRT